MTASLKENYSAWGINPLNFPADGSSLDDQLKFILSFGILAPSGHNGQPWQFLIRENSLEIFVARQRSLPHSDPLGRQLCLGIGCLIKNLKIASDYFGFAAEVLYLKDITGKTPIACINFKKIGAIKDDQKHLIHCISQRSTNRNKYDSKPIPGNFIKDLQNMVPEGVEIFLTQDKHQNKTLADNLIKAQIEIMADDKFRLELSELIKANNTKSMVGMPGFAFGLPFPVSLLSSWMIKKLNMSKINEKADREIFENFTPGFLVIAAKNDDLPSWFVVGEVLENIWLQATRSGLSLSVNAAPIQGVEYRKQLASIVKTSLWPLVFSRIGFGLSTAPHVPRLRLKDVLLNNI